MSINDSDIPLIEAVDAVIGYLHAQRDVPVPDRSQQETPLALKINEIVEYLGKVREQDLGYPETSGLADAFEPLFEEVDRLGKMTGPTLDNTPIGMIAGSSGGSTPAPEDTYPMESVSMPIGGVKGDILYHDGTEWLRLAAASLVDGKTYMLSMVDGVPSWLETAVWACP